MHKSSFTVFFEHPFWVCVYERLDDGFLRACKITFGAEPKDGEVYFFLLSNFHHLVFGPAVEAEKRTVANANPKQMQRAISKQMGQNGIGTKAQQALHLHASKVKLPKRKKAERKN